MANEWYNNADARGYRNYNYYDDAQPFNENLTNENYGKSLSGSVGHFDPRNMMRPRNLTQDLGASMYQAPPPATVYPGERNIHEGFGTADVSSTFQAPEKTGILQNIKNWGGNILDNTMIGKFAAMNDATNPRAFNYNPALQGQIDFLESGPKVEGLKLGHGVNDASGLNRITSGALQGKNLQSMFGSNDLIDMYNKQIARHDKTIAGFGDKWSRLKEDDIDAYNKKLAIHQQRKKWAQAERDAVVAGTTGSGVEGGQTAGMRGQLGRAVNAADRRNIEQIQQHTGRQLSDYRMDRPSSERQFTGHGQSGMGRSADRFAAEGGRIGYRDGEFVDENINVEGPNFDVNENVEMAEGPSPFEMRIEELMDEGMSWEEAYQIASQEFSSAEGQGDSFSEEGIASIV